MPALGNTDVARLLVEFGQRVALRGGNPYRARAYSTAAESLVALTVPLGDLIAEDRLREIPGVGDAIAEIITTMHRTGSHPGLERMRREIPASVLEFLTVPGLRPDKALKVYNDLHVATLDELEQACRDDRLKPIKGLGPALQRKNLQGIEIKRMRTVRTCPPGGCLLAAASRTQAFASRANPHRPGRRFPPRLRACERPSAPAQVPDRGAAPRSTLIGDICLHLAGRDHYGLALLLATGSAAHVQHLVELAAARGIALEDDGLQRGGKVLACPTEEAVYEALGLPFIEPELREGRDEFSSPSKAVCRRWSGRRTSAACFMRIPMPQRREHVGGDGRSCPSTRLQLFRRHGSLPIRSLCRRLEP